MTGGVDVTLYTDGACLGNPGPGGWAAIACWRDTEKPFSGGAAETTNNRMELQAVIEGLNAMKRPVSILVVTDSQYVMKGVQQWMAGWKRNGWKTASKKSVANQDLWLMMDEALARHKVSWQWVKGHAGHEMNEKADLLAREEAQAYQGAPGR